MLEEHIDESQWLPKGIAIVTPERQAMLEITIEYDDLGLAKHAQTLKAKTLLDHLFDESILDSTEYQNGRDYQTWREMFRVFCGSQRMTANYGETKGSVEGSGYRESGFSYVLRTLPKTYQQIIDHALDTPLTPTNRRDGYLHKDLFQRVFNRLGAVMDLAKESMQEKI